MCVVGVNRADALTLMVDGTTPARRWQQIIDRSRVPTDPGIAALRLDIARCTSTTHSRLGGCYKPDDGSLNLELDPYQQGVAEPAAGLAPTLMHEVGHRFDAKVLNDGDRARFQRIWKRAPGTGWWQQLAPYEPGGPPSFSGDGTRGAASSAGEWFADAYAVCATERTTGFQMNFIAAFQLIPIHVPANDYGPAFLGAQRKTNATCRLIESAAARATS